MIDGIGGRPIADLPPLVGGEDLVEAPGGAPLEALFTAVDELDDAAAAAAAAGARGADRDALEEALTRPPAAHAAVPIDLGRITGALARAVRPRAQETPAQRRMREAAEKYLKLRLEVAAGMARISVG